MELIPDFSWIERSRLWLVLDRDAAQPRSLLQATQLCIAGGVNVVVFRMRDATAGEVAPLAHAIQCLCLDYGVNFVLSHFVELADELQPDALHVGVEDLPVAEIRLQMWNNIAGYSAHSVEEAQSAVDAGADYVFLGPIFETPSKMQYGPPLGVGVIAEAEALERPVVYIGGMNEQTIPLAVAAGAKRVAAISALLSVPDPTAAARRLRALLPD